MLWKTPKNERWNPPDSPSRTAGFKIIIGTDTYNEFADVLSCQNDTDLNAFDTAFGEFKIEFLGASNSNVSVSSDWF